MIHGFEIIKVQDQPEYEKLFDMGGNLGERVQEMADQDYASRIEGDGDCGTLIHYLIEDYWDRAAEEGPKAWSPKPPKAIGPLGLNRLCKALRDGELPETESIIRDATYYAWDKAYLPTENDIRYALQDALSQVPHDYGLSDVWMPLLNDAENEADEVSDILESLMHTVGGFVEHFQPYQIQFNFMKSRKVGALQEADKDLDRRALDREFEYLRDAIMETFWEILEKDMKAADPPNRVEWQKEWVELLKDKKRVQAAQIEMLDYLKGLTYP